MMNQKTSTYSDCGRRVNIINMFRKLWEQHIMWTRSFIISTAANLGDLQFVTQRLLRNPVDFANELQKYYGAEKANKFNQLLTDHLKIAAQLVDESMKGNIAAADATRKKWYQNADEIAEFLSTLNPVWTKEKWQSMLHDHLQLTEKEATLRLNGQYDADVALYDEIEKQALSMADLMSLGIIKQYNM